MSTPIKKRFYHLLTTLLLSTFMLAIPYTKSMELLPSDDEHDNKKQICVFLDGKPFVKKLSEWHGRTASWIKANAIQNFYTRYTFPKMKDWNYKSFTLYDYDDEFDDEVLFEVDKTKINNIRDDGALQLVLVHKSNQEAFLEFVDENSNNCVNFIHNYDLLGKPEKEKTYRKDDTKSDTSSEDENDFDTEVYVYFDKNPYTKDIKNNVHNEDIETLKESAFQDFKEQGYFSNITDSSIDQFSLYHSQGQKMHPEHLVYESHPLDFILVHSSNEQAFSRFLNQNFDNSIDFQHNPSLEQREEKSDDKEYNDDEKNKEAIFHVYFNGKKVTFKVNDFNDKTGSDIIKAFFDKKDINQNIHPIDSYKLLLPQTKNITLSILPIEPINDLIDPLEKWAIVKTDVNKWNDSFVETEDEWEWNDLVETDKKDEEDKEQFFVYFKYKNKNIKQPFDLLKFNQQTKVIIDSFFNSHDIPFIPEEYNLMWGSPGYLTYNFTYNKVIISTTIKKNDKWAIVKSSATEWHDELVQSDDELDNLQAEEHEDELDGLEVEESYSDSLHSNDHDQQQELDNHASISVFFNRKKYQVPQELRDKSVKEIMEHVVTKLPSPFNTIIPQRIVLVTSRNNKLIIKSPYDTNLHTISNQWLAIAERTLNPFLNWRFKKNYFLNFYFSPNGKKRLRTSFEGIKNYCNIYPQCQGKIISPERHPLYDHFYDHLASNMGHLLEKCASQAYYDMYSDWKENPQNKKCPITLMIGLENISEALAKKQEDQERENEEKEEEKREFEAQNPEFNEMVKKEDLRITIFNDIQEDCGNANEFHIIETKNILKFRTEMYTKYNTRRKPPIPQNNLRILFYHKYIDIECIDLNRRNVIEDFTKTVISSYKEQTLNNIPAIGKYFEFTPSLLTLMSGKINLDLLCNENRIEEIHACLQPGKTLTLIPKNEPDLMQAYLKSLENGGGGVPPAPQQGNKKHIIIASVLGIIAALTLPKKKNTQPVPIAGPKDTIVLKVTTQSVA